MYNREERWRGTLTQGTPWTVGPTRLSAEVDPIAADPTLSLIAASAKDKVAGRHSHASSSSSATLFRGRVSGIGTTSAPSIYHSQEAKRSAINARVRVSKSRSTAREEGGPSAETAEPQPPVPGEPTAKPNVLEMGVVASSGGVMRTKARDIISHGDDDAGATSGAPPPSRAVDSTGGEQEMGAAADATPAAVAEGDAVGSIAQGSGDPACASAAADAPAEAMPADAAPANAMPADAAPAAVPIPQRRKVGRRSAAVADDIAYSNFDHNSPDNSPGGSPDGMRRLHDDDPTVVAASPPRIGTPEARPRPPTQESPLTPLSPTLAAPGTRTTDAGAFGGASPESLAPPLCTCGQTLQLSYPQPQLGEREGVRGHTPNSVSALGGIGGVAVVGLREGAGRPRGELGGASSPRAQARAQLAAGYPAAGSSMYILDQQYTQEHMRANRGSIRRVGPPPPKDTHQMAQRLHPSTSEMRAHLASPFPDALPLAHQTTAGGAAATSSQATPLTAEILSGVGYGAGYGAVRRGVLPLPASQQPSHTPVLSASAEPRGSQLLPLRVCGALLTSPVGHPSWDRFDWAAPSRSATAKGGRHAHAHAHGLDDDALGRPRTDGVGAHGRSQQPQVAAGGGTEGSQSGTRPNTPRAEQAPTPQREGGGEPADGFGGGEGAGTAASLADAAALGAANAAVELAEGGGVGNPAAAEPVPRKAEEEAGGGAEMAEMADGAGWRDAGGSRGMLGSLPGRELLARIHEAAVALTDKEFTWGGERGDVTTPGSGAPSASGGGLAPLLGHAVGKPAGALCMELCEPAAEAALRAALPRLRSSDGAVSSAAQLVRYLIPMIGELRRRLTAARDALRKLHRSLPPPPADAAPLSAVAVGRMLLSMAAEGSEHPGAAAARVAAPEVSQALDEWQGAGIADALGSIASDLALHAHTLAGHLRRALPPAQAAELLQGIELMAPPAAVLVLASAPRLERFRMLAATGSADAHGALNRGVSAGTNQVAEGFGIGVGTGASISLPAACATAASSHAPTVRWAQVLAQQLLTALWRLHRCGVIPAPPAPATGTGGSTPGLLPPSRASTHDASLASLSHGFHDPQTTPSQQSLATGGRPRAGGLMQPRRAVGGTQPTFTQAASHSQPKQRVLQQGSLQRLCAFPTTGKLPFLTALVATPQAPAGADAGRQPPSVGLMHSKSAPGFSY